METQTTSQIEIPISAGQMRSFPAWLVENPARYTAFESRW